VEIYRFHMLAHSREHCFQYCGALGVSINSKLELFRSLYQPFLIESQYPYLVSISCTEPEVEFNLGVYQIKTIFFSQSSARVVLTDSKHSKILDSVLFRKIKPFRLFCHFHSLHFSLMTSNKCFVYLVTHHLGHV